MLGWQVFMWRAAHYLMQWAKSVRPAVAENHVRNIGGVWMCSAVAEKQVRVIVGVFLCCKRDTTKFSDGLGIEEGGLLFQPCWAPGRDEWYISPSWSAVADRSDIVLEHVRSIVMHPACVMVRGFARVDQTPGFY